MNNLDAKKIIDKKLCTGELQISSPILKEAITQALSALGVIDQIMLERDLAVEQLEAAGLGLGQAPDTKIKEKNQNEEMDAMIRATIKAGISTNDLLDTCASDGLIGVYNLGLQNMLNYLREKDRVVEEKQTKQLYLKTEFENFIITDAGKEWKKKWQQKMCLDGAGDFWDYLYDFHPELMN